MVLGTLTHTGTWRMTKRVLILRHLSFVVQTMHCFSRHSHQHQLWIQWNNHKLHSFGDYFLKLAVSVFLYCSNPDADEGNLTACSSHSKFQLVYWLKVGRSQGKSSQESSVCRCVDSTWLQFCNSNCGDQQQHKLSCD